MFGQATILLIGALLIVSVAARAGLLFVVSILLLLTALAARIWERHGLDRLEYRRSFSQRRAFFGEEIDLVIEVVNRKVLPVPWLKVEEEVPTELAPPVGAVATADQPDRSRLTSLLSLRWYERVRRRYRIRCVARGYHRFGPARLQTGDPFGFADQELVAPGVDYLLVYPKVVPLPDLGLPPREPFGDLKAREWIFEDPVHTAGVREYAPGDDPRRVHWKATARSRRLQVKILEPSTTHRLLIALNMNVSGPAWWWQAYDPELLEQAISAAASIAHWAVDRGYQVGLSANGKEYLSDQRIKIPPGRDPDQLPLLLAALGKLIPVATQPLETILQTDGRALTGRATVVVITALLNGGILTELLALRAVGHRVALLLAGDQVPDPKVPGILVRRIGRPEAVESSIVQTRSGPGLPAPAVER
ncbi:MAG TPA: DUF58 domain-containing protein [Dehalococcoidia bacterium]|nr:DUF58 domain-containing protein [Dehalococcoidia bacterium]